MFKVLALASFAVQLVFAGSASAGMFCSQQGSCYQVTPVDGTGNGAVSAAEPATALVVGLGLAGAAFLRRRRK